MNIQDWSPLGWTGWISLQSKGFSRVFSNTTIQKHQFFSAQLSTQFQLSHPYMTLGKTIPLNNNKSPCSGPTLQVGLTQAPIKLLLILWVLGHVTFGVHPVRARILISPSPLGLLKFSLTGLHSKILEDCLQGARSMAVVEGWVMIQI